MSTRVMRSVLRVALVGAVGLVGGVSAASSSAAIVTFGQPQAGPGRIGSVYGAGVVPPLTKAFSFATGYGGPFVPVDSGRAFTLGYAGGAYTGPSSVLQLEAVNLSNGTLAWTQTLGTQLPSAQQLITDGGKVFTAVNGMQSSNSGVEATVVSAYSEATGAVIWRATLDEQGQPASMIASNGTLYLTSSGSGGTVWALNESTGARQWTTMTWSVGPLTLAGNQLVISGANDATCALNSSTGQLSWSTMNECPQNIGTGVASFDGTDLWDENPDGGNQSSIYNPAVGTIINHFNGYAPAFGQGEAVNAILNPNGHGLAIEALNPTTQAARWTFAETYGANDPMGSMPLLADGYVFLEGSYARVWALNACTGAQVWNAKAGSDAPYQGLDPLPDLSAANGYLIVPTQTGFTAFKGSSAPTGTAPTC